MPVGKFHDHGLPGDAEPQPSQEPDEATLVNEPDDEESRDGA